MSYNANIKWMDSQIEAVEEIIKMPFVIFDEGEEWERWQILSQLSAQDAATIIKIYYDLYNFGYVLKR